MSRKEIVGVLSVLATIVIGIICALIVYIKQSRIETPTNIVECVITDKYVSAAGAITHHNIIVKQRYENDTEYDIIVTTDLYNEAVIGDSILCKAFYENDKLSYMEIASGENLFKISEQND